jgi:hypothetical protein
MFIKKAHICPIGLMLVALLIGLSGCGASNTTDSKPDRVRIQINDHLSKGVEPVVTLSVSSKVQQLYSKTLALPQMPEAQPCTLELGRDYTLVFLQGKKTLASVLAQRYGCEAVTIAGEKQNRQATQDFWSLLDQAVSMATPAATSEKQ